MRPVIADDWERVDAALDLRKGVFVDEIGLFSESDVDEYDLKSDMVLVEHDNEYIACCRIVQLPSQINEVIEVEPGKTAEVSRFLVVKPHRGNIEVLRQLIKGMFAVLAMQGIPRYYCIIDPRLHRKVKRIGINLEMIKEVNYLGKRYACLGYTDQYKDI